MTQGLRISPWQVWWVDFGATIGHERRGARPTVIVSSLTHCRFPIGMALVVPLTTRDRGLEHHVLISSVESGLSRPSWARTEDLTAASTERFTQRESIGTASVEEIEELSYWLREMVAF